MDKNNREIIKAELNRLLNEELSVSSIVTTATNNISKLIINKLSLVGAKRGELSIKRYLNKIGKVITKYKQDIRKEVITNGGLY